MKKLILQFIDWIKYGFKKGGLYEERDDSFGANLAVNITSKDLVNQTFIVGVPQSQDQKDSDFCVGYSGAYGAEMTEDRQCSGAFLFAMSKKLAGSYKGWGTSILKMCKARIKFGVCKKELWDYKRGRRDYYANWKNIPQSALHDAEQHKGESYFRIYTPLGWTKFDTLRAYSHKLRHKKVLIYTGRDNHAITVIGYVDKHQNFETNFPSEIKTIIKNANIRDKLICIDSYGTRTYHKGFRFLSRSYASRLFNPYIILDIKRTTAEILKKYNGKCVKLKDDPKCYLIKDGLKHHIKNEITALSHGIRLMDDVERDFSKIDFDKIKEGSEITFYDGQYHAIVQRAIEYTDKSKLNKLINN